jgi:hypothetical protein
MLCAPPEAQIRLKKAHQDKYGQIRGYPAALTEEDNLNAKMTGVF